MTPGAFMCVTVGFWLSSLFFMYGTRSSLVELMCVMVGFSLSFCGNELYLYGIYLSISLFVSIYLCIYLLLLFFMYLYYDVVRRYHHLHRQVGGDMGRANLF